MLATPAKALLLRCPMCAGLLAELAGDGGFICPNEHQFGYEAGLLVLLDGAFAQELAAFLAGFERLRSAEGKRLTDTAVYETLPFTPELQSNPEWRMRRYDLAVIGRLLAGRQAQSILEIGAWNGWLSNWLTQWGHRVTAVDYFSDEVDGLRAHQHYRASWQTIQMDLTTLSLFANDFDIVILNRCLPFFADPLAYALSAAEKVRAGGLLIATGLAFFQDYRAKAQSVVAFHQQLKEHGLQNIKPMKGYLDFEDKRRLAEVGIGLRPYAQLWPANLKSRFKKSAPRYFYGVYQRPLPAIT